MHSTPPLSIHPAPQPVPSPHHSPSNESSHAQNTLETPSQPSLPHSSNGACADVHELGTYTSMQRYRLASPPPKPSMHPHRINGSNERRRLHTEVSLTFPRFSPLGGRTLGRICLPTHACICLYALLTPTADNAPHIHGKTPRTSHSRMPSHTPNSILHTPICRVVPCSSLLSGAALYACMCRVKYIYLHTLSRRIRSHTSHSKCHPIRSAGWCLAARVTLLHWGGGSEDALAGERAGHLVLHVR